MTPSRKAAFFAVFTLTAAILITGCGDTFRPIAIPIPVPGPDPQGSKQAVVLSSGGGLPVGSGTGSSTFINLAGDTNVGQVTVGKDPVHAASFASNTRVAVANQLDSTLSLLSATSPLSGGSTTISLPSGAAPVFVFANAQTGTIFVAMSGLNQVGVVTGTFSSGIPVAGTPVALTGSADGNKLYSANANGTVSVIDARNLVVEATVGVGGDPRSIVISPDGQFVYVANSGSGTVSRIATATNAVTTIPVGASPNFAFFDARLLRVYVTNSGGGTVSIINADPLAGANFGSVATVVVGAVPTAVTVLADGSKAYVSNAGSGTVSVISSLSNVVLRTIAVGTSPDNIVSSADGAKVAVLNKGSNTVTTIRSSDDQITGTVNVPASATYMILSR